MLINWLSIFIREELAKEYAWYINEGELPNEGRRYSEKLPKYLRRIRRGRERDREKRLGGEGYKPKEWCL